LAGLHVGNRLLRELPLQPETLGEISGDLLLQSSLDLCTRLTDASCTLIELTGQLLIGLSRPDISLGKPERISGALG
jgi:hypothetical protein